MHSRQRYLRKWGCDGDSIRTEGRRSDLLHVLFYDVGNFRFLAASVVAQVFSAPILTAIYIVLMWIAGCVMFGFAILIQDVAYQYDGTSFPVHPVNPPPPDSMDTDYNGIATRQASVVIYLPARKGPAAMLLWRARSADSL